MIKCYLYFPVPVFYFGEEEYHVDESDGYVEVKVWRTGTDLSKTGTVTVRSRKSETVSAEGECSLIRLRLFSAFLTPTHVLMSLLPLPSFFLFVLSLAGVDYVGISRNLDFAPGVSMQTFRVTILDDLGHPELEGTEKFDLVLRMPASGILGEPAKTTVFINDSVSDCK